MFDAAVKGCDVVLGSRFSRESVLINYPLRKILFNRTFHLLASLLFRQRLRDVTNNLSCSVVRWCRIWIWSCPGLEPMQKLDSSRCLWGIECTPSPSPGSIVPQTWGNQAFRFLEPAGICQDSRFACMADPLWTPPVGQTITVDPTSFGFHNALECHYTESERIGVKNRLYSG
jgi:hypothetical protein